MKKYFLFGVIAIIAALAVFSGYQQVLKAQVLEEKERERDFAHLNYIPVVRVGPLLSASYIKV